MTSTFESGDKIQQDLGMAPTALDNSHTVHPKRAPADAPLEHQSSASSGSNTLSQETRTPDDTPEDCSISQTTGIKSTDPDNQSDDEDEDEDGDEDEDSASTDEDSDEDFPRFEDAPRGRIVKPVSGPKPTKPPK